MYNHISQLVRFCLYKPQEKEKGEDVEVEGYLVLDDILLPDAMVKEVVAP